MRKPIAALLIACGLIAAGCSSNQTKTAEAPPAQAASASAAAPAPAAEAAPKPSKPTCTPETTSSKKKSAKAKKAKPAAPADCEPTSAPAKGEGKAGGAAPTATVAGSTAGAAAAPSGAGSVKTGTDCKPCSVKSRDGSFDGEVYGNIPANSKWAKLQIGMHQSEVERILGATSNIRGYVTAKAFIPFYFGTDSHRYEAVYVGQGSVAYTGGSWGGGQGVLMMINYDPKIE